METINNFVNGNKTRPCWVNGRRAIWHRWTDSARPVKPWGQEDDESAKRFQTWNVLGLVEYEDGTVARVWPNEIQFADGGEFADYCWETMEEKRDALPFGFDTEDQENGDY